MDDQVGLFEHKTLASLKVTVEARAEAVQRYLKKRAEDIDACHPGSTFVQDLVSYGKYCVLVSGPFVILSSDFNPLADSLSLSLSLSLSMHKRARVIWLLALCLRWF